MAINLNPKDASRMAMQNAQAAMNDINAIQNDLQSSMGSIGNELTDLKSQVSNLKLSGADAAMQQAMIGTIDSLLVKVDTGSVSFNQIMDLVTSVKSYLGQVAKNIPSTTDISMAQGTPLTDLSTTGISMAAVIPITDLSQTATTPIMQPLTQMPTQMPTQMQNDIQSLISHTTTPVIGPQIAANMLSLANLLRKNKDLIVKDLNAITLDINVPGAGLTTDDINALQLQLEDMLARVKKGALPQNFQILIANLNKAYLPYPG
jgi:hypothetical protein